MSNARFYVGNISWDATASDLRDFFSEYTVLDAKIITDRETNKSRGFGFVELKDVTVDEVIADMDGRDFMGRQIKVNEAMQKPGGQRSNGGQRVTGGGDDGNPRGRGPARGRPRPRTPRNGTADAWKD